ncbi:conserved hypothetical protein [Planktothrix serta PCC 8927]|uniref:Uncharacterized protein n=1 Tax=Planktothrix serta PCC 8927 TaxID=671068 RepID=A0A7Z9BX28_9CYAN|nr:hypothetical protein [Planktothrix serta]VXD21612.1 conserved hypothetical protein [Planktothrix serta PCC 8927]
MNEFLTVFESMTDSMVSVLNNPGESSELKQSATELNQSIQSCTEELRQSAARLKELMEVSYKDLDQAEDVWNSKARIMSVPKSELWEQIGELTAIDFRIRELQKKCQTEVIQEIKNLWLNQCEQLKETWFKDSKTGTYKQDLGYSDKDGMIQGLDKAIKVINNEVISSINTNLLLLNDDLLNLNLDCLHAKINFINSQDRINFALKISFYSDHKNEVIHIIENSSDLFLEWIKPTWDSFLSNLNNIFSLIKRETWDDLVLNVNKILEDNVQDRFSECFDFALSTTTEIINFYNDILEKQNRYEQETPEQREGEKVWIDQQRQKLDQVQKQIDLILSVR